MMELERVCLGTSTSRRVLAHGQGTKPSNADARNISVVNERIDPVEVVDHDPRSWKAWVSALVWDLA